MMTSQLSTRKTGPRESAKVMFEIFREQAGDRPYRVIYYTELDEKQRDAEIERAMAGEHIHDGFLRESTIPEAKIEINIILDRLNNGQSLDQSQLEELLTPYSAK
jgi:hypothetical protein